MHELDNTLLLSTSVPNFLLVNAFESLSIVDRHKRWKTLLYCAR